MSLFQLILYVAIAALLITLIVGFVFKKQKLWALTYLQNFCGSLFIFSGWVKAIDPLGTAFKMEQYFAEFQALFAPTWFSFISPFFSWMSGLSVSVSVFMIVLEIVLGVMLIVGSWPRVTAWLFFLIIAFFTALTGFTYLTGYVPSMDSDGNPVNFFQFSKWGPWVETNMKVTDCGCFGDFLILEPYVSFLKDVFLMIPAILFLFLHRHFHQLFNSVARFTIPAVTAFAIFIFCLSNFVWDLPVTDFRPFKNGVNVAEQKALEDSLVIAAASDITFVYTNKETGEVAEVGTSGPFPTDPWELTDRRQGRVTVSKIYDFAVSDLDGMDITEDILTYEGYHFMVVGWKMKSTSRQETIIYMDTIMGIDTLVMEDTVLLTPRIESIEQLESVINHYTWDQGYIDRFTQKINPLAHAAEEAGIVTYAVVPFNDPDKIEDFRHQAQTPFPFYTADDILLKTMIRSNPGVILWHNGKIVKKWHIRKLPDFETIRRKYMD